jgi:hypothetical protein
MAIVYYKWPQKIPVFPFQGPPKFISNCDFWFKKKPSGNPGTNSTAESDQFLLRVPGSVVWTRVGVDQPVKPEN